jgi:hypothetical protein
LAGGSTYDSDIFNYNGLMEFLDFGLFDLILSEEWPRTENDSGWDPSTDINVRFPDGAEASVRNVWPADLAREIGLGDYGPMNVQFPRNSRAPFLDLDVDNSSGARGVDYATTVFQDEVSGGVPVVDSLDVGFGNSEAATLASLTISIVNPKNGDQVRVDENLLPPNITAAGNGTATLTLSSSEPGSSVANYTEALRAITLSNATGAEVGVRVVTIQAVGSTASFTFQSGDGSILVDQRQGNLAISRISIQPSTAGSSATSAIELLSTEPGEATVFSPSLPKQEDPLEIAFDLSETETQPATLAVFSADPLDEVSSKIGSAAPGTVVTHPTHDPQHADSALAAAAPAVHDTNVQSTDNLEAQVVSADERDNVNIIAQGEAAVPEDFRVIEATIPTAITMLSSNSSMSAESIGSNAGSLAESTSATGAVVELISETQPESASPNVPFASASRVPESEESHIEWPEELTAPLSELDSVLAADSLFLQFAEEDSGFDPFL